MKYIRSAKPSINKNDVDSVKLAISDGWGPNMNKYINNIERKISNYIGKKYCLSVSHCTDAIHLALLSMNIGKGDEVIVPDLTWVASAAPIKYVGAVPVFIDVKKDSWCVDEDLIEKRITKKTKAIIVVDLLGNMPNWNKIKRISKKYNIKIIEDSAESIGAKYKNKIAGSFGDISVFSFNATKLIMSGQGGMFCTNNKKYYEKAKLFKNHGIDSKQTGKYYWSTVLGYNYNWTNFQAALALSQFSRIAKLIHYKKWLFKKYKKYLNTSLSNNLNYGIKDVKQTYWITCLILDPKFGITKEIFIKKMKRYKIDIRPMFYPLSSMPTFNNKKNDYSNININSYDLSKYGICLPNGNDFTESEVKYICTSINKMMGKIKKKLN